MWSEVNLTVPLRYDKELKGFRRLQGLSINGILMLGWTEEASHLKMRITITVIMRGTS